MAETTEESPPPRDYVLTLMAPPGRRGLHAKTIETARHILKYEAGAIAKRTHWLARDEACDVYFQSATADMAWTLIQRYFLNLPDAPPLDMAVQATSSRRKRLLAADMDSTLIENEVLVEVMEMIAPSKDALEKFRHETTRALNGDTAYVESLKQRTKILARHPFALLEEATKKIRLSPGGRTLVRTMRANGAFCMLISSGFQPFTGTVADMLGLHLAAGNHLEIRNGAMSGNLIEPVIDGPGKREKVRQIADQNKISMDDVLAVGDSANDIPLLESAGLGVAYHAAGAVVEAANVHINHGDLSALLYLQGYPADDWRR